MHLKEVMKYLKLNCGIKFSLKARLLLQS